MTGVAFTVGSLSNAYFYKHEKIVGKIVSTTEKVKVLAKKERGLESAIPCDLLHIDTTGNGVANVTIVARGHDVTKPDGKVVPFSKIMPTAKVTELGDGRVEVQPCSSSFTRAVVQMKDGSWMFNTDSIIPTYIGSAMPRWFGTLFMLTLLAAAMSTLSSQFHALGTSFGRDMYARLTGDQASSVSVTKLGIIIGLILAVIFGYYARGGFIVARATAIFFGLCASAFLPTLIGGLFFRWATKAGAIASMIVGAIVPTLWLIFINDKEARALGLCFNLTQKYSLLADKPNWYVVDQLFISLPISILVFVVVSLITQRPAQNHLDKCFRK
jgi:SSS family solute:Na+ symporter